MARRSVRYFAAVETKDDFTSADPGAAVRRVRAWHEEFTSLRDRPLAIAYRVGGESQMYVGLGDRRGVYLNCNYGKDRWDRDLLSVGPGGLSGRRRVVEFNYFSNPLEVPVQCLVPAETALGVLDEFLRRDALPLSIEWASMTGIERSFKRRRRRR